MKAPLMLGGLRGSMGLQKPTIVAILGTCYVLCLVSSLCLSAVQVNSMSLSVCQRSGVGAPDLMLKCRLLETSWMNVVSRTWVFMDPSLRGVTIL
jgi:hypothetical protein